ncbi:hypothetical protein JCM8097_009093 [Rhodosporidiobolus ruineniae]
MDSRIRPSLADLASEYDAPAFPELDSAQPPAARIVRGAPPAFTNPATAPVPVIPSAPSPEGASAPPPSKPKSRFALQREKEAAERAAASSTRAERFELNLEDDEGDFEAWKPSNRPSLVKDILERPVSKASPPQPPTAPGPSRPSPLASRPTGFPASSRGLFPRKPSQPTPKPIRADPPIPLPSSVSDVNEYIDTGSVDGLLGSVSQENEDVLRRMSEAQILEEQRSIREDLGLSEGVLRMLAARAAKKSQRGAPRQPTVQEKEPKEEETTPRAEPSSRTRPLPAGAAPSAESGRSGHELDVEAEEEGSPEYIRRHFFPNEPHNPNLDWMRNVPPMPKLDTHDTAVGLQLRSFDLHGAALPESATFDAAPHVHSDGCGEHHVSSSSSFTIPSLLSLTASSVPSQRSTAFTVLHRILTHPSDHAATLGQKEWEAFWLQLAQKASWALRDSNRGVVSVCVDLLDDLLSQESARGPVEPSALSRLPNAEEPSTVLSHFLGTSPLLPLANHLSLASLPRSSLLRILAILTSLIHLSRSTTPSASSELFDALFSTPKLLESLVSRFVATPWPRPAASTSTSEDDLPTPSALSFLTLLASSSRSRAKLLVERKAAEAPLRFLAVPPWELDPTTATADETKLGYELLGATLELWAALGRYGLATGLRTQAGPLLDGLGERVSELVSSSTAPAPEDVAWVVRYLDLLSIWTTAAVDPHVTGHDITWSQVEGWKAVGAEVVEWALEFEGEDGEQLLAAAYGLLGSWLEGSKVNRSWRGEQERKWVKESAVGKAFEAGGAALQRTVAALERMTASKEVDVEHAATLAAATLRLSDAYADESEPVTPQLFELNGELVKRVVQAVVRARAAPGSTAVALLLLPRLDLDARLPLVLDLLPLLGAQDAVAARDQVDWILRTASSPSSANLPPLGALHASLELPSLAHLSTLRPFFTHAIVTASGGRVVGPLFPSPRDIKLTACLASFAPTEPVLAPDWPLVALNELLRSATSPVFEQLPAGTEISELQLVRSSLALMRLVVAGTSSTAAKLSASTLVYDLIKVFMLEKDNGELKGSSGADTELFRDEAIQHSLSELLSTLSVAAQPIPQLLLPDSRPASLTIEGVSSAVSSAPFYQLYTDLLGLYDSISLSNRLFGLVLLPPLAMSYPTDYRRLLWTDYSHLLRTLRFSPAEAISDKPGDGALAAYLEPREENATILGAYVDALVAGAVTVEQTAFLHLVAVHHVAAALFAETSAEPLSKIAAGLAKALTTRGAGKVLRTLLEYGQEGVGGEVRMPPACYGAVDEALKGARVERLRKLVGAQLEEKLDELVRW